MTGNQREDAESDCEAYGFEPYDSHAIHQVQIWQCSDRSELGKSLEDVWSLIHKKGQLEHV